MKNFIFSALQFLLLFYLFLSGPLFIFSVPFVLIQGVSILFIFWALLAKKLYKHPVSRRAPRGVYLITQGPYEIVRHPVYAGFLLFVLSYSPGYYDIFQYLAFLFFMILTLLRIQMDEQRMEAYFKDKYRQYKKQTKRLIPYVY